MMRMIFAVVSASIFAGSPALADRYSVSKEVDIEADADAIWSVMGDFCDIDDWHPSITSCSLAAEGNRVRRMLILADGGEILEEIVAVEPGLSYTYRILSSPFPIDKYVATLSMTRGEPNRVTWSGNFMSDDASFEAVLNDFYEAGLRSIAESTQ